MRLIDFGLGNTYSNQEKLHTSCGSPCYAAPEIINGVEYDPLCVDIWSCGVTLYCMAVGQLPFDEKNKTELYKLIRECRFSIPSFISAELASLIKSLLVFNPKARLTLEQVRAHPWMKRHARCEEELLYPEGDRKHR